MAGPHAHDDNVQHDVTPTDAPTAESDFILVHKLVNRTSLWIH